MQKNKYKSWSKVASILSGPRVPNSLGSCNIYNIVLVITTICNIIITDINISSSSRGVTPLPGQRKAGPLAKRPAPRKPLVTGLAARGRADGDSVWEGINLMETLQHGGSCSGWVETREGGAESGGGTTSGASGAAPALTLYGPGKTMEGYARFQ